MSFGILDIFTIVTTSVTCVYKFSVISCIQRFHSAWTVEGYTDCYTDPVYFNWVLLQLSEITVNESDVFDALIPLNPNKAQGCDNVNPHVLKYCCTFIVSPVTHLFSTCLNQSTLPQEWKVHKICPIPKKGDLSKVTNYRPISLLCCLSKVLESIIYAKMIPFVYPQLNKYQEIL